MWNWFALLAIPLFWVLVDTFGSIRARKYQNETLNEAWSSDFSILVPIYGNTKYVTNAEYLSQYASQVVLCTTSGETEEFYQGLNRIATQHGFRIYKSPYSPVMTSKKRRTGGVVRDRVIRDALVNLQGLGAYTICIDADTETPERLERLAGALEASGVDFASVELVPQSKGGLLVQLQRHEYRLSMRMRFLLPWMLSGACHIAKTEVLRTIMQKHSLFFQGNDVEAGLIGDQLGYKAVHFPFQVYTEVPSTLKSWWRQRLAWSGGEFRLFITNIRFIFKHPLMWAYGGLVAILTVGLRWWSISSPAWVLLFVLALYYIVALSINWRTRNWWLLVLPVYALFYSLIMVPIGIVWYFVMAIPEKNFGIIRPNRRVNTITS